MPSLASRCRPACVSLDLHQPGDTPALFPASPPERSRAGLFMSELLTWCERDIPGPEGLDLSGHRAVQGALYMELAMVQYMYGFIEPGARYLDRAGQLLGLQVELSGESVNGVDGGFQEADGLPEVLSCVQGANEQVQRIPLPDRSLPLHCRRLHLSARHLVPLAAVAVSTPLLQIDTSFSHTGAMGKRTVHQIDAKAQLVVVATRERLGGAPVAVAAAAAAAGDAAAADAGDMEVEALGIIPSEKPCVDPTDPGAKETAGLTTDEDVFVAPVIIEESGKV